MCWSQDSEKARTRVVARAVSVRIFSIPVARLRMLRRMCSMPSTRRAGRSLEVWKAVMDAIAWYNAGESRASGQTSVRQGFSVGPSFTDKIPQVCLSKRSINISGLPACTSGCRYILLNGSSLVRVGEAVDERETCWPRNDIHISASDICGSLMISSTSPSSTESCVISICGKNW